MDGRSPYPMVVTPCPREWGWHRATVNPGRRAGMCIAAMARPVLGHVAKWSAPAIVTGRAGNGHGSSGFLLSSKPKERK